MASVDIDIPGVGTVQAHNAATESTLQELVNILSGRGGGGGGGGGTATAAAAGAAGGAGVMSALQRSSVNSSKALSSLGTQTGSTANALGKGVGVAAKSVMRLGTAALQAGKMVIDLAQWGTGVINTLSNVGDSLSSAAQSLNAIPFVGEPLAAVLGAVAGAAEKSAKSYKEAAASGATFGGSISNFSRSATEAGMTIDQFGAFIKANGAGLLGLGATTEEGAKRFGQISKALRATSNDLYALGFGTQEINQGLVSYTSLLRSQGLQGTKNNVQLAEGAKKYMKELDALAKITGEERSTKEAQMKALAVDAQFQMAMAGKSAEARESFMKLVGGFGPTLGGFVKDFVSTGTVTTEENAKIAAALGGDTMNELTKLRQKLLNNQVLSDEEQDRLREVMKKASDAGAKQMGTALAASRDNDAMSKAYIEGMQLQIGAVKKATVEQNNAAEATDGQLKRIEDAKQKLAEFSNTFTQFLASSGLLDTLMKAFGGLASFTTSVLIPGFKVVEGVIEQLWTGAEILFEPIKEMFQKMFSDASSPMEEFKTVIKSMFDMLDGTIRGSVLAFEGAASGAKSLLEPLKNLWNAITNSGELYEKASELYVDIGSTVGGAFEFLGAVLGDLIDAVTGVVTWFKDLVSSSEYLSGIFKSVGQSWSDAFELVRKALNPAGWELIKLSIKDFVITSTADLYGSLRDMFDSLINSILYMIPTVLGGISKSEKEQRDKEVEDRKKAREAAAAARSKEIDNASKAADEDLRRRREEADRHKKEMKEDSKKFNEKTSLHQKENSLHQGEIDKKKDQIAQDEAVKKDYNNSLQLLQAEAVQQHSKLASMGKEKSKVTPESPKLAAVTGNEKSKVTPESPKLAAVTGNEKNQNIAQTAESGRKAIESEADKRKQDEAKKELAKADEAKKTAAPSTKPEAPAAGAQESAETLLASLNSKMDQLIKINYRLGQVSERQLTVQQGLTNDLFVSV